MPTVEFVVSGVPVSAQAKNHLLKRAYRSAVVDAARAAMADEKPFDVSVHLDIKIFSVGGVVLPDTDNVVKLVRDAMEGIVYANDRQAHDNTVTQRSIDEPFVVVGVSKLLLQMINLGAPFMYVRATTDIDRSVIR